MEFTNLNNTFVEATIKNKKATKTMTIRPQCVNEQLHYSIQIFESLETEEILCFLQNLKFNLSDEMATGLATVLDGRCPKKQPECLN